MTSGRRGGRRPTGSVGAAAPAGTGRCQLCQADTRSDGGGWRGGDRDPAPRDDDASAVEAYDPEPRLPGLAAWTDLDELLLEVANEVRDPISALLLILRHRKDGDRATLDAIR
jgi:hypothetical protein